MAFLIDSNVLIYAYDAVEVAKRERAIEVLRVLRRSRLGVLSLQVIAEFFNASTRGKNPILERSHAGLAAQTFLRSWPILEVSKPVLLDAVRFATEGRLSIWDGMICATAKHNSVWNLLTEDLGDGQVIEGVRVLNPFAAAFDLAILS